MAWVELGADDSNAIHDDVSGEISALTEVVPAEDDVLLIEDASDGFSKKKIEIGDISTLGGVWMPLTTVVAGEPELVWDDDDSLIPTKVPI